MCTALSPAYYCIEDSLRRRREQCPTLPLGTFCYQGKTLSATAYGYYNDEHNVTAACLAGYFCPGDFYRYPCQAGSFSGARAMDCTSCPKGQTSGLNATGCSTCGDGTFEWNSTACLPCRDRVDFCTNGLRMACPTATGVTCFGGDIRVVFGMYLLHAEDSLLQECSAGHYCPGDYNISKHPCEPGTFANAPKSTKCSSCRSCAVGEGMVSPCTSTRDAVCGPCKRGEFSEGGDNTCKTCGVNEIANKANSACIPCKSCAVGEGLVAACSVDGDTQCSPCKDGEFSSGGDQPMRTLQGKRGFQRSKKCLYSVQIVCGRRRFSSGVLRRGGYAMFALQGWRIQLGGNE